MSIAYIDIPVVTDSDVMIQQALSNVIAAIPGWVPREGNIEVILMEQFALLAAEAGTVASNVGATIFAYYGSLVGINPLPGTSETITVKLTLVNPAAGSPGYQIPAGTIVGFYFSGAAYQFATIQDYLITTGNSSIVMTVQAVTEGADYDLDTLAAVSDLSLTNLYLSLNYQDPLVSNILLTSTPATNTALVVGTDAETTSAYLNRLASELQLLAPRPITPLDYTLFSGNVNGIFRAMAFDGVNPFTNLFSAANANFTIAATSGSAPAGWAGIGDGTNLAGLSTPGTAPSNYLKVTTSSTALFTGVAVTVGVAAGATSLQITVAAGNHITTSVSASNPAIISITDATAGNEVAVVIGATAVSSGNQTLTLASGLVYAHTTSATVNLDQGAMGPLLGAAPGSLGTLAPNSIYYQASAVVECGSDTTATARPHLVCLATYLDGSTRTFSSVPQFSSSLYDYTSATKTILCEIPVYNSITINLLAPSASSEYNQLKPTLCSVQRFVVWGGAGTSKTHYIYYNSLASTPNRFDTEDSILTSTGFWNFVPDANLESYYFANSIIGSWTVPAGVVALPGFGVQCLGTGAALGSALTVTSQIFNLSNLESDLPLATTRDYTLFATINSTSAGTTFADITVEVWDLSTGAILQTGSSVNVEISPTAAGVASLVFPFVLTAAKDVEVRIVFSSALNVPINSSVIVSQLGIMSGTLTSAEALANQDGGYSWTPGGLYSLESFNYARMITICPINIDGFGINPPVAETLVAYLEARREVNFTVNIIQPGYVPIDVRWSGYVLPGYTVASVQTAVNTAIENFLSPANWGGGLTSPPSWDGSQVTVRVFDIAGVINSVAGMGSITSVTTRPSYPLGGSYAVTDIVMGNMAALPISNIITATLLSDPANAFSGLS